MRVRLYIEKKDFNEFYRWINKLKVGDLCSPTFLFSNTDSGFENPLQIILHEDEYSLVRDAEEELENMHGLYVQTERVLEDDQRMVKESLINSRRHSLEVQVVSRAIEIAMDTTVDLTPGECMLIAEREFLP
jgi:hypothetical protein